MGAKVRCVAIRSFAVEVRSSEKRSVRKNSRRTRRVRDGLSGHHQPPLYGVGGANTNSICTKKRGVQYI